MQRWFASRGHDLGPTGIDGEIGTFFIDAWKAEEIKQMAQWAMNPDIRKWDKKMLENIK